MPTSIMIDTRQKPPTRSQYVIDIAGTRMLILLKFEV
jgi:hypothetical protein